MTLEEIRNILPHREPFLFLDRIVKLEPGRKAVGEKDLAGSEAFFAGHFPGFPVMPGVLMIEAMAQCGAVAVLSCPEYRGKAPLFAGIEEARFKRLVRPGEKMEIEIEIVRMHRGVGKGRGVVRVGGDTAVEGVLLFKVADWPRQGVSGAE